MSDDKELPDGHPMREIHAINKRLRDNPIQLAREGDRDAVKQVFAQIVMEATRQNPVIDDRQVIDFLAEIGRLILDGATPNEAFGWTQGRGGQPLTAQQQQDRAVAGSAVADRMARFGESLVDACSAVAEKCDAFGITPGIAEKAYRRYIEGKKVNSK